MILGAWVNGYAASQTLARLSVVAFQSLIDKALRQAYRSAGGRFVDVTAASGAYVPFARVTTVYPYGSVPVAVARVCELTYYCAFRDIHCGRTATASSRSAWRGSCRRGGRRLRRGPAPHAGLTPPLPLGGVSDLVRRSTVGVCPSGSESRTGRALEFEGMSGPALVAVDEDAGALRDVERELQDRYARHYRVVCMRSSHEARACLEELAEAGEEVALVLAGQWLSGMTGTALLDEARHLHPHAKRGLLIAWGGWGDRATGEAIFDAIAHGRIDHYLLRPSTSPDELFHQAISSLLLEWAEARRASPYTIHVVAESWSGRAYELREALERCAVPHAFCLADSSTGRALIAQAGDGAKLPLVVFPDGTSLTDPSNAELARAAGSPVNPERMEFDLVIAGAGPAGLSAAVYGASEGFSTLVVDEGGIGGQATSSSSIRNYLGFPRGVSGRRLARGAYEQAWVFGANFAFMQRVTDLRRDGDGLFVTLSHGSRVRARAAVLATGASYRRLGVPALEALNGAGVFYGGPASEAPAMAGQDVYVLGGANSAAQAALYLARYARRVTLVVRAQALGAGMSHYLVRQVEATPRLEVRLGTGIVGGGGDGWLERLVLRNRAEGSEETVEAGVLFVMIGARPHTEWLPPEVERDARGFVLTGADLRHDGAWPLHRSPFLLETSMPAVFAAGDVRHGSVNRVAAAVGDGSVAIQLLHRLFVADRLQPRGRPREPAVAIGR